MDILTSWYNQLYEILKAYPPLQSAFLTVMSGGVMAAVGFGLVRFPKAFILFVKNQFYTSLIFNTASSGWSEYNQQQYVAFIKWFSKNRWFGWSRVITFDTDGRADGSSVGPGIGRHFFIHGWRLFIFTIGEMDSQGTTTQKYKISLSCLGRSKKPLYRVMDEFMVKPDKDHSIGVYRNSNDGWNWVAFANKRPLNSVVMSGDLEKRLIGGIQNFIDSEQWYRERGLSYKQTCLLYGPPGTGKSSLCRVIASKFNRDLYILQPTGSIDILSLLQRAKGGVVIIEDIDGFSAARSRTKQSTSVKSDNAPSSKSSLESPAGTVPQQIESLFSDFSSMNPSDLLNALEGVIGLDDVIIIMTTNHPEKLDPALIRDGRVDLRIEVGLLTDPEIKRCIELYFPTYHLPANCMFEPIAGCTLQKYFLENRNDPDTFVRLLLGTDVSDRLPTLLKQVI